MCVVEQFVQPVVVVVVLGIANLSAIFIYATIISKGRKLIELRVLRIDVDPNFVVLASESVSYLVTWVDESVSLPVHVHPPWPNGMTHF